MRCTKTLSKMQAEIHRVRYTRKGYSDPYEAFQMPENTTPVAPTNDIVPLRGGIGQVVDSRPHETRVMGATSSTYSLLTPPVTELLNVDNSNGFGTNATDMITPFDHGDASFLSGYGPNGMGMFLEELEWDSLWTLPEWSDAPNQSFNLPVPLESTETTLTPDKTAWQFTQGFQLQQIDGVEGKCVEIRDYLRSFQTGFHLDSISKYITRDRLVNCVQLYRYYQSVQPILHLPTFELTKTSPVLLVAMMLVGACYSNNDIPAATIVQCAIHVLLVLESSPVSIS